MLLFLLLLVLLCQNDSYIVLSGSSSVDETRAALHVARFHGKKNLGVAGLVNPS